MGSETWYLCTNCKGVAQKGPASAGAHLYCPGCGYIMPVKPVAVLPLSEYQELQRLREAVVTVLGYSGVTPYVMGEVLKLLPEADRAALRQRAKGGT